MTNEQPQVSRTGKYSVMETSRKLGIHRNTLNRYVTAGIIKCKRSKINNRKFFTGEEILRAWRLCF